MILLVLRTSQQLGRCAGASRSSDIPRLFCRHPCAVLLRHIRILFLSFCFTPLSRSYWTIHSNKSTHRHQFRSANNPMYQVFLRISGQTSQYGLYCIKTSKLNGTAHLYASVVRHPDVRSMVTRIIQE